MAEALQEKHHWKRRMDDQSTWIINEIYRQIGDATKFSTRNIHDLGDELDDESLLLVSSSSWQTLKKETKRTKTALLYFLVDRSIKNATTRIIFMKMLYFRARSGIFG